ncbi:MAG: thiamine phosphate synthase [Nitrospirae bacterium]|nr:MAG: thiamine phosphate synthase [Nitrospirota bacterium]
MVSRDHLRGLYLILDAQWANRRPLLECLKIAATCGVTLFQYRNKTGSMREMYHQARQLREEAARHHVCLIINDRCDLALAVDADGVHLGQDDLPLDLARDLLGPEKLIGVSTHRADEIHAAAGADYLAFGPIFPTSTKPNHQQPVGLEGLKMARSLTAQPLFAIGGITLETSAAVLSTGVQGIAVASAILNTVDFEASVRAFLSQFTVL